MRVVRGMDTGSQSRVRRGRMKQDPQIIKVMLVGGTFFPLMLADCRRTPAWALASLFLSKENSTRKHAYHPLG